MAHELSIKGLKSELDALNISYQGVVEKSELVRLVENARNPPPPPPPPPQPFALPVQNMAGDVVDTIEVPSGDIFVYQVQAKLASGYHFNRAEINEGVKLCLGDTVLDSDHSVRGTDIKEGDVLTVVFSDNLKQKMMSLEAEKANGPYILRSGTIQYGMSPVRNSMIVLLFPEGLASLRPVQMYHVNYTCNEVGPMSYDQTNTTWQFSDGIVSADTIDLEAECKVEWKKSARSEEFDTVNEHEKKPWAAASVEHITSSFCLRHFAREDEQFWQRDCCIVAEAIEYLKSIPENAA